MDDCHTIDPEAAVDQTIRFTAGTECILVLDEEGMIYKGQRIEDAGEAHRAFLDTMAAMGLAGIKGL